MADIHGSAEFSDCGLFRWRLDRWWADGPRALICGANPSKAGAEEMDPTMHRVVALTRGRWSGYTMVNGLPYIATDPAACEAWRQDWQAYRWADLRALRAKNHAAIRAISPSAAIRIVAWGNLIAAPSADLLAALSCDGRYPLYCWGETNGGSPKHPLARGKARIPADLEPMVWRGALATPSPA